LGEVTRCAVLKKTDGIPLPASFGSVIVERIIDILMLLLVIFLALVLQFGRIGKFFSELFFNSSAGVSGKFYWWAFIFIIILAILAAFIWARWDRIVHTKMYKKIRPVIGEVFNGFMSIKKVENKPLFFVLTFGIWIFYYLMSYVIIYSFPATSGLSPLAGLVILMAGGLGMSAPVQGGIGTYHAFVSSALLLYGIAHEDGIICYADAYKPVGIYIVYRKPLPGDQHHTRKETKEKCIILPVKFITGISSPVKQGNGGNPGR
jgi:hypothetical protein